MFQTRERYLCHHRHAKICLLPDLKNKMLGLFIQTVLLYVSKSRTRIQGTLRRLSHGAYCA